MYQEAALAQHERSTSLAEFYASFRPPTLDFSPIDVKIGIVRDLDQPAKVCRCLMLANGSDSKPA
jgi:hypothetical protein